MFDERQATRVGHRTSRNGVLSVFLVAWLCTTAASPAAGVPVVAGVWEDGTLLLSVAAAEVPLHDLLAQIAELVGFQIEGPKPTNRAVSVNFERWPLEQGLKRLLRPDSFAFVSSIPTDSGERRGGRLILLGGDSSRRAMSAETLAENPPNATSQGGVQDTSAKATSLGQAAPEEGDFNPDAPLPQLIALLTGKDGGLRTAALEALTAHAHDPQARRTLLDQVSNPDPEIRNLALTFVGPYVTEWAGADDVVLNALLDGVPTIRQLALQVLVESSSPRRGEAIRLARMDKDADVRARVEELLQNAESSAQK